MHFAWISNTQSAGAGAFQFDTWYPGAPAKVPFAGTEIAHMIDDNGVRIELLYRDGAGPGPDREVDAFDAILVRGAKHVGFLVDDVDAAWEELQRRGAEPLAEPVDVPPAGIRNCWIRDPDGTQIEINQWLGQ